METFEKAVTRHAAEFTAMLARKFRMYGIAEGLPAELQAAIEATPRHLFVHRFRLGPEGPLQSFEAEPAAHLPLVYSDAVLSHVDAAGEALPSTSSEASYVLLLVHMLGLRPGHKVLEIGSGSGWLAGVMARLVGPSGHATGVEIISDLAERSRADFSVAGVENITIVAGDGTRGHAHGAPYDRVMITAATWDVPGALFDQVADGGRLLVPIALGGGRACHVALLRRDGYRFVAEASRVGWFVPLFGSGQDRAGEGLSLQDVAFCGGVEDRPTARYPFWLGGFSTRRFGPAAPAFRTYLAQTERGFAVFDAGRAIPDGDLAPFGILDEAGRSLALCRPGELVVYGERGAAERLARAYARWTQLGMPAPAAFDLEIVRAGSAPDPSEGVFIDRRGDCALVWRVKPGLEDWSELLA